MIRCARCRCDTLASIDEMNDSCCLLLHGACWFYSISISLQNNTAQYSNVSIKNFTTSWSDGLAFCALIHNFRPDAIAYNTLDAKDAVRHTTLHLLPSTTSMTMMMTMMTMIYHERERTYRLIAYVHALSLSIRSMIRSIDQMIHPSIHPSIRLGTYDWHSRLPSAWVYLRCWTWRISSSSRHPSSSAS